MCVRVRVCIVLVWFCSDYEIKSDSVHVCVKINLQKLYVSSLVTRSFFEVQIFVNQRDLRKNFVITTYIHVTS